MIKEYWETNPLDLCLYFECLFSQVNYFLLWSPFLQTRILPYLCIYFWQNYYFQYHHNHFFLVFILYLLSILYYFDSFNSYNYRFCLDSFFYLYHMAYDPHYCYANGNFSVADSFYTFFLLLPLVNYDKNPKESFHQDFFDKDLLFY